MDIEGRNILVLGGAGMVGSAVARGLIEHHPARLVLAARRGARAEAAVADLGQEYPDSGTELIGVGGDVFLRAEAQAGGRAQVLNDPPRRKQAINDIYAPLDDEIIGESLLAGLILGHAEPLNNIAADIVVDCMNTASALSYQDVYSTARGALAELSSGAADGIAAETAERLLASLYIPQLVRHLQLLLEAMRRAGTRAYVKVGTSGSGGMGLNIPYTHGEERPSRLVLSKSAVAGAQSLLTFLMARTPGGPDIVKEVKPSALIGWRDIGFGTVSRGGAPIPVFDCPMDQAVSSDDPASMVARGAFGVATGDELTGVYIDTGENGVFTADEFATITALGQMEMVTPEEIADAVVREIIGANTGLDIVAALDGSIMGPTYRGGALRSVALRKLRALEAEHGKSIAFEMLGPPRLSKLLFEVHILHRHSDRIEVLLACPAKELASAAEALIERDAELRRHILSIGLPILLTGGRRLLRGPEIKSGDAYHGWVDLTAGNMAQWQARLGQIKALIAEERIGAASSRHDRVQLPSRTWADDDRFEIGDVAAWIFTHEDRGMRGKR
ncbi:MAG: hypothetical protein QGH73_02175 [Rhodospirillales bacterium]|nr:short-chain dehydrogenase [Rhodospirillaceae bacterium]MDP6428897.1 hypothetical protein [Rhodospirillales bacterium]MDP6644730.1 hypothetical protein [Rhodospirillales bacterium]MDP6840462.1 hypothetical protein [Rhodospirillales bacterium]